MTQPSVTIHPVTAAHRQDWERLYSGYAEFYKVNQTAEMREKVWSWLMDPLHEVNCFIAEDASGKRVGLAHFRPFSRPLSASTGGYLDDLFVDPTSRGQRVADALIAAVADEGRKRGWSVIRWITADDNYRGRGVYDRVATLTKWRTYDIAL